MIQGKYFLILNFLKINFSIIWAFLFKKLIELRYVPAIIIPKGFPNLSTFLFLNSFITEEYSTSLISFRY